MVPTLENDFFTGGQRGLDEAFIQNEAAGNQVKRFILFFKKNNAFLETTHRSCNITVTIAHVYN